jgi:hypothetical protein
VRNVYWDVSTSINPPRQRLRLQQFLDDHHRDIATLLEERPWRDAADLEALLAAAAQRQCGRQAKSTAIEPLL